MVNYGVVEVEDRVIRRSEDILFKCVVSYYVNIRRVWIREFILFGLLLMVK